MQKSTLVHPKPNKVSKTHLLTVWRHKNITLICYADLKVSTGSHLKNRDITGGPRYSRSGCLRFDDQKSEGEIHEYQVGKALY
jgi:hypothetical protein